MNGMHFMLNALPGILILVTAIITGVYRPKKPNAVYGYRTRRSMASQEAWNFANKLAVMQLYRLAAVLLAFAAFATRFMPLEMAQVTVYMVMVTGLIVAMGWVERRLKMTFDDGQGKK
jgi:uncharacterized membrane protein